MRCGGAARAAILLYCCVAAHPPPLLPGLEARTGAVRARAGRLPAVATAVTTRRAPQSAPRRPC